MSRPQINTTARDWKKAVEDNLEASREDGFVADFLNPLVAAINNHRDTVDLPDDDDLSIAKCDAYIQNAGFSLTRIGDRDRDGKCKYRIFTVRLEETR